MELLLSRERPRHPNRSAELTTKPSPSRGEGRKRNDKLLQDMRFSGPALGVRFRF